MANKKGVMAGSIVDWYSYLAFILMMILFYFLFSYAGTHRTIVISGEQDTLFGDSLLNTYLQTPLVIEGEQRSVSSWIEELAATKDPQTFEQKRKRLATFTDSIFSQLTIGKYILQIKDVGNYNLVAQGTPKPLLGKPVVNGITYHYAYLPSPQGYVTVNLILYSYEAAVAETPPHDTK